ncbi:MAG: LapA family protein [Thermodesulfobacteriota bacterium]
MNRIKSFLWLVLAAFVLIVFFSNLDFFLQSQQIKLNFLIKNYSLPELPSAILFLFFFAAGILVAYFSNLPERFRLRKTIKNLKATIDSQEKEIAAIRTYPKAAAGNSTSDAS